MDLAHETIPKPIGSAYDEACDLVERAYGLNDPEGTFVVAEAYSETVWLMQPESRLVTVIQKNTIPNSQWLDTLAIYQEEYVPSKTTMGQLDVEVIMYRLESDGTGFRREKIPVSAIGKDRWIFRKLEADEAFALASHLAQSTVRPPAILKYSG